MDYKRLRISLVLLAGTISFGTIGYHLVENMDYFDSLYMTVITISTVGFSEIKPLTTWGRVITIMIISTGITIGAYTIGMLLQIFIEGEIGKTFGRRKLEKQISDLKDHYIICGFGRIGQLVCKELSQNRIKYIVIEKDAMTIEQHKIDGMLSLEMDSTTEEALLKAGIMKAKGIVTAVQSDADNVFITLTAKGLRPDIFVLARASDQKNEIKLIRAGASRVVSPYLIGGRRMAQVLIKPTVVDFIDIAMMDSHLGLRMEEAPVRPDSDLVNKSLIDSHLRKNFGVIIVAIKKKSSEMIFNPLPSEKLEAGDVIVVLGKVEDLAKMRQVL